MNRLIMLEGLPGTDGAVWSLGNIHWIGRGRITTLKDDALKAIGNTLQYGPHGE